MSATLPLPSAVSRPAEALRGRIGRSPGSGFPAAPHRYRLHLADGCPESATVAVVHRLLGLAAVLPVTPLSPAPGDGRGHLALHGLYEATRHRHPGPFSAPVLSDDWTGRIVSNHTPDIVRDLVLRFRAPVAPELCPAGLGPDIDAFEELLDRRPDEALAFAETRLAARSHLFGSGLTTADIRLWAHCATGRGAGESGAPGPHVGAHLRNLEEHPAFQV